MTQHSRRQDLFESREAQGFRDRQPIPWRWTRLELGCQSGWRLDCGEDVGFWGDWRQKVLYTESRDEKRRRSGKSEADVWLRTSSRCLTISRLMSKYFLYGLLAGFFKPRTSKRVTISASKSASPPIGKDVESLEIRQESSWGQAGLAWSWDHTASFMRLLNSSETAVNGVMNGFLL